MQQRIACTLGSCVAFAYAFHVNGKEPTLEYHVSRTASPISTRAKWNDPDWQKIRPLVLTHHMGDNPEHFPDVQVKLAYDTEAIYVIFRVADRYVRATAKAHQDSVCIDSCVEFFFTPGDDTSAGYFNLEVNCGGTILLHYQREPRKDSKPFSSEDLSKMEVFHSMPKLIEREISEPTEWFVVYRLPIAILQKYFPETVQQPASGLTWRANFYKCADKSSHPHWLTWSPVQFERPDFHRPTDFGVLRFE